MLHLIRFALVLFCIASLHAKDKTDSASPNGKNNPALPNVVVVTTGGTIAEKPDAKTGGDIVALSGDDLVQTVPELGKIANIQVITFSNIDSSQMTPEMWAKLSTTVDAILAKPDVKGVVVTHGTDTIAPGSFFLSRTLKSTKPVVFVGAMRDASAPSADGAANILNAVIQVCSEEARHFGVTVTMNQYINAAEDVRKVQSTNVQALDSGEKGYLGYICLGKVKRFRNPRKVQKFPVPTKLPKVVIITEYAGADGNLVRFAVDDHADGIVVNALGSGNVNAKTFEAIKYALSKKIPVVITTSVFNGGVYPIYSDPGGGETLALSGAILGGDLNEFSAAVLLTLAIPQYQNNPDGLRAVFLQ